MAFSSGTYSLYSPGNPVVTGTTIASSWANNTLNDVATALSTCVLKDGTQTITGNIPMSNFKFTGLAAASAANDSVRAAQLQLDNICWAAAGGAADVITATYVPANASLVDGMRLGFRASAANATTTPTFSPDGLTAHTITKRGGGALVAGDIPGNLAEVVVKYNLANTRWEIINPTLPFTLGGSLTLTAGALADFQATQTANTIFAGPASGAASIPTFRALTNADTALFTPITNALAANVSCTPTGSYVQGPIVAQSTAGTWFVSGTVLIQSGAIANNFNIKLWDGTTVLASSYGQETLGVLASAVTLSGFITNPAGSLRISVADLTDHDGLILFNQSGASKDSTLTAIRIG